MNTPVNWQVAEPINKLGPHVIGGLPCERSLSQTIICIIMRPVRDAYLVSPKFD